MWLLADQPTIRLETRWERGEPLPAWFDIGSPRLAVLTISLASRR